MNTFRKIWTKKLFGVPVYGIAAGIFMFILQRQLYVLADAVADMLGLPWHTTKIAWIDDRIGLFTPFIIIYVGCYITWIIGPMTAAKCETGFFKDFMAGMLISYLIGALVFALYPTRMDRVAEGLINDNPGFFNGLLQAIYRVDGGQYGTNLAPSYHCLISTCCYLAVRKRPEISKWFRVFSLVLCILVYASTVFCKQHYFIDIPTGIAAAVFGFALSRHFHLGRVFGGSKN